MKRFLAVLVAIAATAVIGESTASAQQLANGYQFGAGVGAFGCGNGFLRGLQREQAPYFAKFPPVYYSHIVKRPYGISPYAAPAGIRPVEMDFAAPVPVSVKNPFIHQPVAPVVTEEKVEKKDNLKNKATWVSNPFIDAAKVDVRNVSFH